MPCNTLPANFSKAEPGMLCNTSLARPSYRESQARTATPASDAWITVEKSPATFADLPYDVSRKIANEVDRLVTDARAWASLATVNRGFCAVYRDLDRYRNRDAFEHLLRRLMRKHDQCDLVTLMKGAWAREAASALTALHLGECCRGHALGCLTVLTSLKSLQFTNAQAAPESLAYLGCFVGLTHLDLAFTREPVGALASASQVRILESLRLSWAVFSSQDLAHLSRLSALTTLDLPHTDLQDAGQEVVATLPALASLSLYQCESVSGVGLGHLSRLTTMKTLHWGGADLTQRNVDALCGLRSLTGLNRNFAHGW